MPLQLRPATAQDHTQVADIMIRARAIFMPYAPSAHPEHEVRAWVRDQLIAGGDVTLAIDGARVVGVLAVSRSDGASWIDQMWVRPALVGRGTGTLLLRHALSTLPGPMPIRLHTFQQNTGARRFYERHGFQAIAFTDGSANEEHCPDVLYELRRPDAAHAGLGA